MRDEDVYIVRPLTLLDIWWQHPFFPEWLAFYASVERETVTAMLCYQPVPAWKAKRVLDALSILTCKGYGFFNVDVAIEGRTP